MGSLHRPNGFSIRDEVFLIKGDERIHINDFLSGKMNKAVPVAGGPNPPVQIVLVVDDVNASFSTIALLSFSI